MNSAPSCLFVYGTLRPGFSNPYARLLHQQSRYVGEGTMPGQLFDLGSYPGATFEPLSEWVVHGSVFDLGGPTDLLQKLDEYEGISRPPERTDEYVRAIVPVRIGGATLRCWVYLYTGPIKAMLFIESGRYLP